MSLAEACYAFALCLFLAGAAWSLRSDGDRRAIAVMGLAGFIDFVLTMAPRFGIEALRFHVTGTNLGLKLGSIGGMAVWILLVAIVILGWRRRRVPLHVLTGITQIVWFLDYIAFAYGLHAMEQV